ncbi:hypothetical protein [Vibrio metschnikovii]|uniref:hypothetical protein n=1 Tax=Vibrio metschnikovii TaxID=28172 RepID=UPI00165D9E57|nr:hypothetical protein [Vibrio metschnikovii]
MNLLHQDKASALARIKELDEKPFLNTDEQKDYQSRIEIVEEYDRQFRQQWKSDRRAFFKSQLKKKYITEEKLEKKLSEIDADADAILGKQPLYPWSRGK